MFQLPSFYPFKITSPYSSFQESNASRSLRFPKPFGLERRECLGSCSRVWPGPTLTWCPHAFWGRPRVPWKEGVAWGSGTLCSVLALLLSGQLYDPGNIPELNFPIHQAILYALPTSTLHKNSTERTDITPYVSAENHAVAACLMRNRVPAGPEKALQDPATSHLSDLIRSHSPLLFLLPSPWTPDCSSNTSGSVLP